MTADDRLTVGRITITRTLGAEPGEAGDLVVTSADDGCGERLPLVEALGLLCLGFLDLALEYVTGDPGEITDPDDQEDDTE